MCANAFLVFICSFLQFEHLLEPQHPQEVALLIAGQPWGGAVLGGTLTQGASAGTLFLANSAYMYLSIAFIQMLKSLGSVGVFSTGCILGVEQFSLKTLINMVRQLSCSAPV